MKKQKGYYMGLTRNKQYLLKLTDHEYEMIQKKMEQCGIRNMSAYLRKMAVDGIVVNLDLPAFREMLKLANRTAANVNQIAVRCNTAGGISQEDLQDLRDGYREQAEQIKKMVSEVATLKGIMKV
ncbi:MobC family plasmid mobilization relaxosome protein [Fusobacterium naviforme]|nr:MobC family plasmid mobilization relaxosome protein [Fusobacterium naviforme]